MRRLLALIPALALVLALAPAAQAVQPSLTSECLRPSPGADPGPVTATATWTDTADPTQHLLTGLTVDDQCHKLWVALWFRSVKPGNSVFYVWVQPGAVHSFTQSELQSLNLYQRPFFRWSIHTGWTSGRPKSHLANDCSSTLPQELVGYVLADGSIVACGH